MFTVTGTLRSTGHRASIVVELDRPDRRRLSGDPRAVVDVREAVLLGEEVRQTPTGPFFTAALDPEAVALLTVLSVFEDRGVELSGDVPALESVELPPGAVA